LPEVNSPASASPSMLAGMNPPPSPSGGDDSSGRIPGSGSPDQAQGGSQDQQKQGTADAKLKNDISQLRQMEAALLELAQSYPIATKTLRSASDSLRSAQRQIVSSPGLQEPPVPNTFA
jgi:hypothetical protein